MQFTSIIIALLSVAAGAQAGCYKRGDGNNQGDGRYGQGLNEHDIISSVASLLRGEYLSKEGREQCGMDAYKNKWKFSIKNVDGKPNNIDEATIKNYLSKEAYACQYGGKSTQEKKWEVIADPNPGECVSSKPNGRRDEIALEFEA